MPVTTVILFSPIVSEETGIGVMFDSHTSNTLTPMIKPSRFSLVVSLNRSKFLAFNTNSRSFAVWNQDDKNAWDALVSLGELPFSKAYQDFLRGGFVVNAQMDELRSVREAFDRVRTDPERVMITIAPTLSCNFGCHYCFQGQDKPVVRMSADTIDATCNFLQKHMINRKHLHVTWYGGEPLMHKTAISTMSDRLIRYCDTHGIKYSAMIISNGYLLGETTAYELKAQKVAKVQVTIDGDEATHDGRRHLTSGRGTYATILKNIETIARHRLLDVSIRINVDESNESNAVELLDDLAARGLSLSQGVSVYFAPIESVAEAADGCATCMPKVDYAELEVRLQQEAFKRGLSGVPNPPNFLGMCTAMKADSYVVVPNGDLHKCWDTVMDTSKRVGSVYAPETMKTDKNARLWSAFSPFDNSTCSNCKLLPTCAGACAFKFVHNDYASGETGQLPCPSWKFNIAEQLFQRALARGFVTPQDWNPDISPTLQSGLLASGKNHTSETMKTIHTALEAKASVPVLETASE